MPPFKLVQDYFWMTLVVFCIYYIWFTTGLFMFTGLVLIYVLIIVSFGLTP